MGSLLILTTLISAPIHPHYNEASEVFACDFSPDHDRNYDNWPDHWTRRMGAKYPFYVRAAIEDDNEPTEHDSSGNRCLAIHMDGGAAVLEYREIPVTKTFSYILSCSIRADQLNSHAAYVRLTAKNADQEIVETFETSRLQATQVWTQVEIGPWAPSSDDIASIVISLHVEPTQPGALFGDAYFDNVWLARLPRITLTTDKMFNLYTAPDMPLVRCGVSGISNASPVITFELLDAHGANVSSQRIPLAAKRMHGGTDEADAQAAFAGEASWAPPIPEVGFYTIRATVDKDNGSPLQRTLTLAIVNAMAAPPAGIYGWCLPSGEDNLHVRQLEKLVSQSGVNWVKFPVWFADEDIDKADRIAWFAERLSNTGIQLVAVLGSPPADSAEKSLGDVEGSAIALVFSEAEVWQKLLNPVMTRLSLKVRWWQIGADRDASFLGFAQLGQRIREIREHFERFGQEVRLGLAWNWLDERPGGSEAAWSFLSYFSDPPLTARELEAYIKEERQQGRPAWVLMEPLTADHDLETRARDLVLRMIAAKTAGADAAFIPDPFDPYTGLLNSDGSPRELFLPWRTAAMLLANSEYLGQWQLPCGSQNRVFAQGDQAIIVIWNDHPVVEKLFVGDAEQVKQIDVWGKMVALDTLRNEEQRPEQIIQVQKVPTFIIGANLPISRMRIDFAFDKSELSSTFGNEQTATLHFHNYFPQGVSGEIHLRTPDVWTVLPDRIRFKSAMDEQQSHAFRIFLGNNATSGPQAVQIDFDVNADRLYQFSIYRPIRVGSNEIDFEIISSLQEGSLIIEQHLINRSDQEVSFNCMLFVPGIGRQRRQVLHATRGRRSDLYVIPHGESLIGTTVWLRAEEIGGAGRLLNYHVKIGD